MTDDRRFRHVCVLLHDGHVLTDGAGGLPSSLGGEPEIDLATRARACGDPDAVLVAPEVEAGRGSLTLLSVFGPRSGSPVDGPGCRWTRSRTTTPRCWPSCARY